MTTPFYVQDLFVTRKEIASVQLLAHGVRVELKDESCRIISNDEWMQIVHIFPPRACRLTKALFVSRRGNSIENVPHRCVGMLTGLIYDGCHGSQSVC